MPKWELTGTLRRDFVNAGSKSEHEAAILDRDDKGPSLELRLETDQPLDIASLVPLFGKRVTVDGDYDDANPHYRKRIFIDSINDVKLKP
jgi:hypothetical protein